MASNLLRVEFLLRRHHRAVLYGLLAVHAALLAYSALIHSPVPDEPAHVAAGLSHWRFGELALYRVNPPLVRMVATAPLLATDIEVDWSRYGRELSTRREHRVGDDLVSANGSRIFRYVTIARWACIPFSVLGAMACYWWAKLLFGRLSGLAAAALWCFSPSILGHGSLLTPDVAGTALGLTSCFLFSRWLTAPSYRQALLVGAVLGLAEMAKSTWIILFPAFVVIWIAFRLGMPGRAHRPTTLQLMTILVVAWGLLVAAYGGQGFGTRLDRLPFQSRLFTTLFCELDDKGKFNARPVITKLPIPLPADYVVGLDQQYRDLEGPNRSYLHGVWRTEGWWYYYAYGLAVKEPLGALVLAALSALYWSGLLIRRKSHGRLSQTRLRHLAAGWLVLLCPLTVFVLASINTGMNHHVRYVMPVVPYLYIFAAGSVTRFGPWYVARNAACGLLLTWAIASSLLVYPHSLSYFNELAGGPAGGIGHLSSSNIDWGQDLLLLRDWKQRHAPNEKIFVAYLGRVNPVYADIAFRLPPPLSGSPVPMQDGKLKLEPGWYAISASFLQGQRYQLWSPEGRWVPSPENSVSYFQKLTPVARAGYSIYIYRVEEKQK